MQAGYAKALNVGPYGQVHHAIELQVLDRFPGAFTASELNDIANMRGIPAELEGNDLRAATDAWNQGYGGQGPVEPPVDPRSYLAPEVNGTKMQLHNGAIRDRWDRSYAALHDYLDSRPEIQPGTPDYNSCVRSFLIATRDDIDNAYGQFFSSARAEKGLGPLRRLSKRNRR